MENIQQVMNLVLTPAVQEHLLWQEGEDLHCKDSIFDFNPENSVFSLMKDLLYGILKQ